MDKNTRNEISIAVIFSALLALLLNPFGFFMPDTLLYMMIAGVVVLFGLYAGFVWREGARDEREQLHRMIAGRIAYLAGTGVLVLGIAIQGLTQPDVDPWLVFALGAMVLGKLSGLIYGRLRH